jgi:hypothetical protein
MIQWIEINATAGCEALFTMDGAFRAGSIQSNQVPQEHNPNGPQRQEKRVRKCAYIESSQCQTHSPLLSLLSPLS